MTGTRPRRILLGCFAAAMALSGCSSHTHSHASAPTHRAIHAPASAAPVAYAGWHDPAAALGGDKVLVSTGKQTGGRQQDLPKKIAPGTIEVSMECEGVGRVTVDTGFVTYTADCSARPSGQVDIHTSPDAQASARLSVTADSGVTWAVAVGWNPSQDNPQQ
ncbi:hypothetical protein ACEZDB_14830 [Streptacidiphilus sp. N1-3]|uniref:Lipoprotein n=1 Tax=Streptacidiphilus alkalitolerans TaxID=3342712 RepID=A0ABV6X152_9ACTN